MKSLVTLNLKANFLGTGSEEKIHELITEAIKNNKNLETLDLSINELGIGNLNHIIIDAIFENTKLKKFVFFNLLIKFTAKSIKLFS